MEFLIANLSVFDDALGHFEDDYIIFDCPGQIELYTHIPVRCCDPRPSLFLSAAVARVVRTRLRIRQRLSNLCCGMKAVFGAVPFLTVLGWVRS